MDLGSSIAARGQPKPELMAFASTAALITLGSAASASDGRPPVAQQITWFYSNSLGAGAAFLTTLGFAEVNHTKCILSYRPPGD